MKNILKIQAIIFIILTIISLMSMGNTWLPIMAILSCVAGPVMAYSYPYQIQEYAAITLLFVIAIILMFYGIRKKESNKGVVAFIVGFWLWTLVGLFAGLGTGT